MMPPNPLFTHGIDKLCTICHVIVKDGTHSIFSTLEEFESPVNVLQLLQSFSNFNFYNGPQMVCPMCYDKTIEVYKFIQMCNKASEINMQHYLTIVEAIQTIKDETDAEVKVEEISLAPTRIIIDARKFDEDMENEEISKFVELEMVICGTEIKVEEGILQEKMEKEETRNNEEVTISHTEIVNEERNNSQRAHISKDLQLNQDRHQPLKDLDTDVVCPDGQAVLSRLNTHIRVHADDSQNEVKVKAHKCEQCDRRFTRSSHLRRHMDIHNGLKAHNCEQCDRRFTQASSLRTHMDVHNGVKTYKCEKCDRRFTHPSNLRRHMDIHNGVKPHKCENCDRRFTQASHLRSHMNIHNRVKAHKCEQCDRRFTHASDLRRHINIHNEVKPHTCEKCDRRFTQASHLRSHMNIHNGVKAHKCELCDRRFTRSSYLRSHMNIHDGVQVHKC